MPSTLLLDTHAWVWWLRGPTGGSQLSTQEAAALDALPPAQRPALSDISLWEVATLVELGRLQLNRPLADWLELAALRSKFSRSRWPWPLKLPRYQVPFIEILRTGSSSPPHEFEGFHCSRVTAKFDNRV